MAVEDGFPIVSRETPAVVVRDRVSDSGYGNPGGAAQDLDS